MQIRVLGSNVEVGSSLSEFVKDHLEKSVKKFFEKAISAEAHFSKEGQSFKAVLIVNEGVKKGLVLRSDGEAGDAYGAFSEAAKKIETQLRRYKERIKNYHQKGSFKNAEVDYQALQGTKYVIPPVPYNIFAEMESGENQHKKLEVIAEKSTEIETLSVEEAIMKMDLQNLPALVFVNENNQQINVVYHRKDGNVSWIDPTKN